MKDIEIKIERIESEEALARSRMEAIIQRERVLSDKELRLNKLLNQGSI